MSDDEDRGYASLPDEYRTAEETPGLHRKREARHADGPSWSRPRIVATAPCMVPSCRKPVDLTDEAMAAFTTFSKQLRARGEEPLDLGQTWNCDACAVHRRAEAEAKSATRSAKIREAVRFLKSASADAVTKARELAGTKRVPPGTAKYVEETWNRTEYLERVMGAGYLVELLRAIEEKRSNGKKRTKESEL